MIQKERLVLQQKASIPKRRLAILRGWLNGIILTVKMVESKLKISDQRP
jgi:hypothetical protein